MLGVGCVAMAAAGRGWLPAMLSWPWLVRIGRASYSGYLLHFAVIEGLLDLSMLVMGRDPTHSGAGAMQILCRLALCLGATLVTVLLADLCHRKLEVPLARVTRMLLERFFSSPGWPDKGRKLAGYATGGPGCGVDFADRAAFCCAFVAQSKECKNCNQPRVKLVFLRSRLGKMNGLRP
jgi:peptidoglycan/LPS O-acetylase OafA/YrhL